MVRVKKIVFQNVKDTITLYRLLRGYLSNRNAKVRILYYIFVNKTENLCWFMLF